MNIFQKLQKLLTLAQEVDALIERAAIIEEDILKMKKMLDKHSRQLAKK